MIGIRADGNDKIGIGHIMRCLTIANELTKRKENVVFFLADSACRKIVEERGYECRILDTAYGSMEEELPLLLTLLKEVSADILLVDSYFVTEVYLQTLCDRVRCIYLDDINSFAYPADLIINYNIYAKSTDYPYAEEWTGDITDKSRKTMVLAGVKYAPVREEFRKSRKAVSAEVKDIMITLGGSDAYNLSVKLASRLLQTTECKIHVVCGQFNVHREELIEFARKEERVLVHENVKEMWLLMEQCDLAISAAGSTMCELSAAGVPAVTFSFVENQRKIAEGFAAQRAALSAGHYDSQNEFEFLERIQTLVCNLMDCYELRREVINNASMAVDGHGAGRIADIIRSYNRN